MSAGFSGAPTLGEGMVSRANANAQAGAPLYGAWDSANTLPALPAPPQTINYLNTRWGMQCQ